MQKSKTQGCGIFCRIVKIFSTNLPERLFSTKTRPLLYLSWISMKSVNFRGKRLLVLGDIHVYLGLNWNRKLFYHFCEFLNACLKDKECKHSNFSKWHFLLRHSLRSIECISRRWQKKTRWFEWSRRAIDFDIDSDQLDLFGSSQQWLWQVPTWNLGMTL